MSSHKPNASRSIFDKIDDSRVSKSDIDEWPNHGVDNSGVDNGGVDKGGVNDEFHFAAAEGAPQQAKPETKPEIKPAPSGRVKPSPEILKLRSKAQKITPGTRSMADSFGDPSRKSPPQVAPETLPEPSLAPVPDPVKEPVRQAVKPAPPPQSFDDIGRKAARLQAPAIGTPTDPPALKIAMPEPPVQEPNRPNRPMPEQADLTRSPQDQTFFAEDPPPFRPQFDTNNIANNPSISSPSAAVPAAAVSAAATESATKQKSQAPQSQTDRKPLRRPLPKAQENEQRLTSHLSRARKTVAIDPVAKLAVENSQRSMVPFFGVLGGIAIICTALIGGFFATSGSDGGTQSGDQVAQLPNANSAPFETVGGAGPLETTASAGQSALETSDVTPIQVMVAKTAPVDVEPTTPEVAQSSNLTAQADVDPLAPEPSSTSLDEPAELLIALAPSTASKQPELQEDPSPQLSAVIATVAAPLPDPEPSVTNPNLAELANPTDAAPVATNPVAANQIASARTDTTLPQLASPELPNVQTAMQTTTTDQLPVVLARDTSGAVAIDLVMNGSDTGYDNSGRTNEQVGAVFAGIYARPAAPYPLERSAEATVFAGGETVQTTMLTRTVMMPGSVAGDLTAGMQQVAQLSAESVTIVQPDPILVAAAVVAPNIDTAPSTPLPNAGANAGPVEVASAATAPDPDFAQNTLGAITVDVARPIDEADDSPSNTPTSNTPTSDAPSDTTPSDTTPTDTTQAEAPQTNTTPTITDPIITASTTTPQAETNPIQLQSNLAVSELAKPLPDVRAPLQPLRWEHNWGLQTAADPAGQGIIVTEIDEAIAPSWAKTGQVIMSINGWQMQEPRDVADVLAAIEVNQKSGLAAVPITVLDTDNRVLELNDDLRFARIYDTELGTQLSTTFDGRRWATRVVAAGPDSDFQVGDVIVRDFGARERFNTPGAIASVLDWAAKNGEDTISFAVLRNDAVDTGSMSLANAPLEN